MGRHAVSKRVQEVIELLLLLRAESYQVKYFLLHVALVNTHASPTHFIAVQDHIVLKAADLHGVGV